MDARVAFMYGIAERGSYLCFIKRNYIAWQMGILDYKDKSRILLYC